LCPPRVSKRGTPGKSATCRGPSDPRFHRLSETGRRADDWMTSTAALARFSSASRLRAGCYGQENSDVNGKRRGSSTVPALDADGPVSAGGAAVGIWRAGECRRMVGSHDQLLLL